MNKIVIFLSAVVLFFVTVGSANASLFPQGNGTVYDEASKRYWWQDLSDFTSMNYEEQVDAISDIGYGFHLASDGEMEALFTNEIQDIHDAFIHSGTSSGAQFYYDYFGFYELEGPLVPLENPTFPTHYIAMVEFCTTQPYPNYSSMSLGEYYLKDTYYSSNFGAWVASASPIPIPATLLLFGSGLIGIVGIRRKFKK